MYKNRNMISFFIKTKENKKLPLPFLEMDWIKCGEKKNGDKRLLGSSKKLARELECWK